MKEYNPILGALFSGKGGEGGYNAGFRQSRLAALYQGDDPEKQALAAKQLAAVDPESAGKWQQEQAKVAQQNLERKARMLASAPSLEVKQQLYSSIVPEVRKVWADAPDVYTPELDQMLTSWAGAEGGKPKARSSHILADGTIAFMDEYGNLTKTGEKASNSFRPIVGANGEIVGFDPRTNQADPTTTGGQRTPQTPQDAGDPMNPVHERINYTVRAMKEAGVPVDQINAWADNAFAVAQKELSANGVTTQSTAPAQTNQAKVTVKPEGQMTEYQARMLALAEQRQAQADADRKAKVDLANQKKGDAGQKRNEAVIMSVDDTLNTIDRLEKSPGYAELGTALGDVKLKTPLVRSDVKDANATLKTLAGQIALSTMANLKTLSASGASGFGALTAPELSLLQNSIATLQQEDVSNSQIVESIRVIKEKMAKIKQSAIGAPAPPAKPAPQNNDDDALINKWLK